jgi:putative intracellular protease/amidase
VYHAGDPCLHRRNLLSYLRQASAGVEWTTSVCTGALLLGVAGLLEGKPATTHLAVPERVSRVRCEAGCGALGGGLSADHPRRGRGRFDMALYLVGRNRG